MKIEARVPLAPLSTLQLGGPAQHFCAIAAEGKLSEALRWAADRQQPVTVLGGGSNVVIADAGLPGLTIAVRLRGISFAVQGSTVKVTAMAGEPFDALVAACVERDLAGLECLSGIPGSVGATPVQNVGAYGQEVSDTIESVRVLDRRRLTVSDLSPEQCAFRYRDSAFKRHPDRYIVLSVTFALSLGGLPTLRYEELASRVAGEPTLQHVRNTVLSLRRDKSMVIDPDDDNRRSVGSFFTNPIVPAAEAESLVQKAWMHGLADLPEDVPCFDAGPGQKKLSAAWLIERAGIPRGHRRGHVGVSTRHTLALVHHGGGTTAELCALAAEIRGRVHSRFGVTLVPEPVFLGFPPGEDPLAAPAAG